LRPKRLHGLVIVGAAVAVWSIPALALANSGPDVNWYFAAAPEVYLSAGRMVMVYAGLAVVVSSVLALVALRRLSRADYAGDEMKGTGDGR